MITADALLPLAGFSLISSITPGPNNLMLMASGTNFGLRRTVRHLLGVSLGFTLMVLLVGLGLAQLFATVPPLRLALKVVSVLYLLYLAYKVATAAPKLEAEGGGSGKPMTFLQAAAFQWVNPKAWSMAVTAVTVYAPSGDPALALVATAFVVGVVNVPCCCAWAVLGAQIRTVLSSPARLRAFNLTAAGLLVASLWPVLVSP